MQRNKYLARGDLYNRKWFQESRLELLYFVATELIDFSPSISNTIPKFPPDRLAYFLRQNKTQKQTKR